jgi:hypothetical protein
MFYNIPSKGYWVVQKAQNVLRVGINSNIFKEPYMYDIIDNIIFNYKMKKKFVYEGDYLGSLINNNLEAIHFQAPFNGKIGKFNNQLIYSSFMLLDLIRKDKWLFTMDLNDDVDIKKNKYQKDDPSFKYYKKDT